MHPKNKFKSVALALALSLGTAQAEEFTVRVENLAPSGGTYLTPVWLGFHSGGFDLYNDGEAASTALERVAEDGNFDDLNADFAAAQADALSTVVLNPEGFAGAPVFEPGAQSTLRVTLDPAVHTHLSYAAMVLPSNDAFIGNADAQAVRLFDAAGEFVGPVSFVVYGDAVRDAGSEANTESDAAFFDQSTPNTGTATSDSVALHPGFNGSLGNPGGAPVNFLGGQLPPGDALDPVSGDFTRPGARMLRITVSQATQAVRVSVHNQAPAGGVFLTPVWMAFHDGGFDLFDLHSDASAALERIAEDGDASALSAALADSGAGIDAVLTNPEGFPGAPLFDPGFSSSTVMHLDPLQHRYFTFASMVVPSNDAFIGNDEAMRYRLFDQDGRFTGAQRIVVSGRHVLDAGTEMNSETDAAFLDQSAPNTGQASADAVMFHPGFNGALGNPNGMPQNILGGTNGAGIEFDVQAADFTRADAPLAEIRLSRAVDGGFSGTWYDPDRNGAGLLLEITVDPLTGEAQGVISWYTYAADGSGLQRWLIGAGPVVDDVLIAEMDVTEGAIFGPGFDPDDVVRSRWGQVRIRFIDCETAVLEYSALDPMYGSGSQSLVRLTRGPVDYPSACVQ